MRVGYVSYFEQEGKRSLLGFVVGEETSRERVGVESLAVANAFWIAETEEPTLAMVSSVSTLSDSSEGQMAVQHLNHCIIDDKGPRRGVRLHKLNVVFVFAEDIYDEGFGFVPDFSHQFFEIRVRMQR